MDEYKELIFELRAMASRISKSGNPEGSGPLVAAASLLDTQTLPRQVGTAREIMALLYDWAMVMAICHNHIAWALDRIPDNIKKSSTRSVESLEALYVRAAAASLTLEGALEDEDGPGPLLHGVIAGLRDELVAKERKGAVVKAIEEAVQDAIKSVEEGIE